MTVGSLVIIVLVELELELEPEPAGVPGGNEPVQTDELNTRLEGSNNETDEQINERNDNEYD